MNKNDSELDVEDLKLKLKIFECRIDILTKLFRIMELNHKLNQ